LDNPDISITCAGSAVLAASRVFPVISINDVNAYTVNLQEKNPTKKI
jgi:hypothetical protein